MGPTPLAPTIPTSSVRPTRLSTGSSAARRPESLGREGRARKGLEDAGADVVERGPLSALNLRLVGSANARTRPVCNPVEVSQWNRYVPISSARRR